jgi:uncharacterized heparinase superfamily protein
MTATAERQRAIVGKLARGSLLARIAGSARKPLRLTAVPRDHVEGDRAAGDALLAGQLALGAEEIALDGLDFAALGTEGPLARRAQSFAWLRDLAAAAGRERGSKVAEAAAARWLVAHGTRPDAAWAPELWGERILFWTAYAPYVLSSSDQGYRSALLNTMARGARHLDKLADKTAPGLDRITAWTGVVTAALVLQGGLPRVARAEAGLMRALAAAQFEDGGLMSRSPHEQALLVDRLGLLRSAYQAARQAIPEGLDGAATAALAALHGVTLGDGALSSWQGGNPGDPARLAALFEGCGLRARPLRNARGWGYHRLSALGTIVVVDAAPPPPPRMSALGGASTLAFEMSDGAQRLVVNCGGPGPLATDLPAELVRALRTTAAHSTLTLADTNSTAILDDGSLGRGVADVVVSRLEDNDCTRLTASHDGYSRAFRLIHERSLILGNDGKELRGQDKLVPAGRRKGKADMPYAIRFHLDPDVEAVPTADGMGALLRSPSAPPWQFRCRGAMLTIEDSLTIDRGGRALPSLQLVVVGETSGLGTTVTWQLRRSS